MGDVAEFPNRNVIEQEAVEWLIRLDGDPEPTPEELQELKVWMGISPAHTEEIERLGKFWSNLALTELNIPLVRSEVGSLAEEVLRSGRRNEARTPVFRGSWAIVAGIFGLAILLQQMLFPLWNSGENVEASNGYYATAIGKQTSIPLADGSTVHLNTNSQIKIEYSEKYRNIELIQGEAHFEVAKNKALPFRVYAGEGRVQALGTAFTVYIRDKDVEVLVTEGEVELSARLPMLLAPDGEGAVPNVDLPDSENISEPAYYPEIPVENLGLLSAGEGATILFAQDSPLQVKDQSREVRSMGVADRKRRDSWRKGLLLFSGDPLKEVVDEISRYTTVSIEIIDPELKSMRIGGQFKVGDLDGMFNALETNFDLTVTRLDGGRIQISEAEK